MWAMILDWWIDIIKTKTEITFIVAVGMQQRQPCSKLSQRIEDSEFGKESLHK
jgi:hypothetical protein